ncbi:MAG: DUF4926 domain-containing protein [Desulfamplus sp.]|nr:DUF4926 domain-containing protein [Desulfamplus sp.]
MIKELDTVVLLNDKKEYGLLEGDLGAVVHSYKQESVYEVEFVTAGGYTVAVLTLTEKEIRPMYSREILHARELEAA